MIEKLNFCLILQKYSVNKMISFRGFKYFLVDIYNLYFKKTNVFFLYLLIFIVFIYIK